MSTHNDDATLVSIDGGAVNIPQPPERLGEVGTEFWMSVVSEFDFSAEPGKLAILERACHTKDTIHQLEQAQLSADLITKGSMGQAVISPFISETRQQTKLLESLVKSLGLPESDEEIQASIDRRSKAGKAGANARWKK